MIGFGQKWKLLDLLPGASDEIAPALVHHQDPTIEAAVDDAHHGLAEHRRQLEFPVAQGV